MDTEFWRAMTIVGAIGMVVIVVGAGLLLLAFRAFGSAKRNDAKPIVLMIATLAFVFVMCAGLLLWSLR